MNRQATDENARAEIDKAQSKVPFKLDEEGIPILDEVVAEEPQTPPTAERTEKEPQAPVVDDAAEDAEIRRLARAIAAEAAVAFAREIEGRLMKELAPMLERKLKARAGPDEKAKDDDEHGSATP